MSIGPRFYPEALRPATPRPFPGAGDETHDKVPPETATELPPFDLAPSSPPEKDQTMPTLAYRRSRPLPKLAFVIPLILLAIAPGAATAGWPRSFQRYSERWYGQNFYDGQKNGIFHLHGLQHSEGFYGPAQMYSRQYGDEYGYATARPFRPALSPAAGAGYGPDPFTRF